MAVKKNETVAEVCDQMVGNGGWKLNFLRAFDIWELELVTNLLNVLQNVRVSSKLDRVPWKGGGGGGGGGGVSVWEAYRVMSPRTVSVFPAKGIWMSCTPSKLAFFAWEATWEKILTLDKLQRRG